MFSQPEKVVRQCAPADLSNAADVEQVKGRAPGLSDHDSPIRQTEARAKRTLEPSPIKTSLRTGAGEVLHLPSSRAPGGKGGMTRAKPLVLILAPGGQEREGSLPEGPRQTAPPFGLVAKQ